MGGRTRAAWLYAVTTIVVAASAYAGDPELGRILGRSSALFLAALALAWTARQQRDPSARTGWALIGAHFAVAGAASIGWGLAARTGAVTASLPGWPDFLYIASFGLLITGVARVVRSTGSGRSTDTIDALVAATALGILIWTLFLREAMPGTGMDTVTLVNAALYPVGDLVALAAAGRLWFVSTDEASRAYRLFILGLGVTMVVDACYAALVLTGEFRGGAALGVGWLVGTIATVLGAMYAPTDPHQLADPEDRHGVGRIVALIVFGLLLPCMVALASLAGTDRRNAAVVTVLVLTSFVLVIARVRGLATDFSGAITREQLLRDSGSRLVSAPDRAGVSSILLETVSRLVGHPAPVWLMQTSGDTAVVIASTQDGAGQVLSGAVLADLVDGFGGGQRVVRGPSAVHDALGVDDDHVVLAVWVADGTDPGGVVVVATPEIPDGELVPAIRSVAENARSALDRMFLNRRIVEHQSAARMQRMLAQASDVIAVLDTDDRITYVSPAIETVLGVRDGIVTGVAFAELVADEHRDEVSELLAAAREGVAAEAEVRAETAAGESRILHIVAARLEPEGPSDLVLTCHDVTERHALTRQLQHQAFHDPLTGLANRDLLSDRLTQASARARRTGRSLAVVMLDLDDFKKVNDSLGHSAGDALLVEVAERIAGCLRGHDTAARLGGDEFAVLLEDLTSDDEPLRIARRIVDACAAPHLLGGRHISVAASAGVVTDDGSRTDPTELLRDADLAMYAAKESGKGVTRRFAPAMHKAKMRQLELADEIEGAVRRGEFTPHFQPIVSLASGQVVALEALLRWEHPYRGLLKPEEFLSVAEDSTHILPMSREMIEAALAGHAEWTSATPSQARLRLAVNVSRRQLEPDEMVTDLLQTLTSYGTDPDLLVVEIPESVLARDADSLVEPLHRLADAGIRIHIDDFGAGHGSIALMRRFPIHGIKVARDLVAALPTGGRDARLAESLFRAAMGLDLDVVVAEGVENAEQARMLTEMGFTVAQGFHFGGPVPADQVAAILAERGVDAGRTPARS